jgi:hypothetical protein
MGKNLKAFGLTLLVMLICILVVLGIRNYPNEVTDGILVCTFITVFGGMFIAIKDSLED